jgi:hypothetical protein
MDNVRKIIQYVLVDSDAPTEIRQLAFDTLANLPPEVVYKIGSITVPQGAYEQIHEAIRIGKWIEAIKILRAVSNLSLRESKDIIDTMKGTASL